MNQQTVLTGLFGFPVGQSMSPDMHNAAFRQLGLNFAYLAFAVEPSRLRSAVEAIRALSMRGVNVTIPHKVAVMDYLDDIDGEALDIGAVNTIVNEDGKLIGYNTDGPGYVRSLLEETGVTLAEQRVLLLGAGGAARAVGVSLARKGAKNMKVANRSLDKAENLAQVLGKHVPADVVEWSDESLARAVGEADLIINTTSVGMVPNVDESPIRKEWLRPDALVSDLIYNPRYTKLLKDAEQIGANVHPGLGMFIHQGALAFELWTGQKAPASLMREIVEQKLNQS